MSRVDLDELQIQTTRGHTATIRLITELHLARKCIEAAEAFNSIPAFPARPENREAQFQKHEALMRALAAYAKHADKEGGK